MYGMRLKDLFRCRWLSIVVSRALITNGHAGIELANRFSSHLVASKRCFLASRPCAIFLRIIRPECVVGAVGRDSCQLFAGFFSVGILLFITIGIVMAN